MSQVLFFAMLAFFFTHEMDAVKRHEWRILPLIRMLPEPMGERVFIWLHVPLFLAILWFLVGDPASLFSVLLSGFAVLHTGLHWFFRKHPAYEFDNPGSRLLIIGTALLAILHILSVYI